LRVVFFGTPQFAVPTLEALLGSPHQVAAVVTQPDRRKGRGQDVAEGAVKQRAREAGLTILQPERLRDGNFVPQLVSLGADIGVVAAYGKILTDEVLNAPRLGTINVHASLLPKYRGAAPVHRAVIAGESETGVTIMRIVRELDAGPMIAWTVRPIGPDDTSDEVERDLARLGADLLVRLIDDVAAGRATETPQDHTRATYAPRLTKQDGIINWTVPAVAVHNLIRGLHPWPHAYAFLDGRRYIFLRSTVGQSAGSAGAPGSIIDASGERLEIAAGAGSLFVQQIQAEGRRPMRAREFLAGHPLRVGALFQSAP
jgi:methionyl-tRNA formyltransferase